ncbi:MAG: nucleotide exchange factor GrpE [Acidimicrobiia bacterium]|nr:nucleotide exchange factor GrpE [Acidimicrobiia bacterium]
MTPEWDESPGEPEGSPVADLAGETAEEAEAAAVVEADLARLASERDEYLDALRRVQADFENYRKRMLREQTALVERATEGLVEQLLPVLDSLELAVRNAEPGESAESDKLLKGVELVFAELLGVLEKAGLRRIDAEDRPFDPNLHEAVMQVDGEHEEPVVADVMRTGYELKGRVLRPAMVKVARRHAAE